MHTHSGGGGVKEGGKDMFPFKFKLLIYEEREYFL